MNLRSDLKDYQIALEMWGTNTKEQCRIVKKLRNRNKIEKLCEGYSTISSSDDDIGWIICDSLLEI